MFNRILDFFAAPPAPPRPLPEADSQHLLGALLVRMAQAENGIVAEELAAIDQIFSRRFQLDPVAAARLRAECERLAEALPKTEELGPLLTSKIPAEQRYTLRQALTTVAEADAVIQPGEALLIEQIGALLSQRKLE